ncbi:hypothetical protein ACFLZB_00305 [Nanoarchaeota archaeon]
MYEHKCPLLGTLILLAAGICFLLVDLGVWDFWKINWWTIAFLFIGVMKLGMCFCKECKVSKKRKK